METNGISEKANLLATTVSNLVLFVIVVYSILWVGNQRMYVCRQTTEHTSTTAIFHFYTITHRRMQKTSINVTLFWFFFLIFNFLYDAKFVGFSKFFLLNFKSWVFWHKWTKKKKNQPESLESAIDGYFKLPYKPGITAIECEKFLS